MAQADLTELDEEAGGKCAFCRIVRGEGLGQVVFEDRASVAVLDRRPLLRGHTLLLPRTHYETIHELPEDLIGGLFANVRLLARGVEKALKAHGSFIAINTRVSQSIPHLHIHVVPRWKGDGLFSPRLIWKRRPYKDEAEAERVRDAIRAALAELNKEAAG